VVCSEKPPSATLKIKFWAQMNFDLSREQVLELLFSEDIADEFHAFELSRSQAAHGQSGTSGVNE